MKKACMIGLTALAALIAQPALAGGAGHDHAPKHGGVVAESKEADFELVAKPDAIALYARSHDGKSLDVSKATAKLTLLTAGTKSEVQLAPAADKLHAAGAFNVAKGTKAVALISLPGKNAVTVRFQLK